ncbi:MAG TPA: hypothetical protein VN976_03005 [Verrucomicrobiae bacterium]|nr:hypothetical protein [Verrucomicrobiae bacterium]
MKGNIPTGELTALMRVKQFRWAILLVIFLCICVCGARSQEKPSDDLNVALMQSTFLIKGPAAGNRVSSATVFLLGRPIPNKENVWKIVLVTANHVFDDIQGKYAEILLRQRDSNGNWIRYPVRLTIRRGQSPLWTKNPNADVAVAYVQMPVTSFDQVVPLSMLADDKMLTDFRMTPGTELNCLGYPYGIAANDIGFPVLRGGTIASYPLVPTATYKTFLFDFHVLGGNSGGPVYFSQPPFRGSVGFGGRAQFVVGLVSAQQFDTPDLEHPLSLAVVIQADILRQTIEMLPSPESPEAAAQVLEMTPIPSNASSLNF